MQDAANRIALIGFGEAAMAFARAWDAGIRARLVAFDIKTLDPATAEAKRRDYATLGVEGAARAEVAVGEADLLLSLVTADQALAAARAAAEALRFGAVYCDFNSAAPATKAAAARLIESAGGRYADVAVMAPVPPVGLAVPLLVSGPHGPAAAADLDALGFAPRVLAGPVGKASSVKMLRSVMVKGLEALSAECFLAAREAGIVDEVAAALDGVAGISDWPALADYNLERMLAHGLRRAAEMEEVAATIESLGLAAPMSRAAAEAQLSLGRLGIAPAPGLDAKRAQIARRRRERAA